MPMAEIVDTPEAIVVQEATVAALTVSVVELIPVAERTACTTTMTISPTPPAQPPGY